jgi:hypothetical protein
MVFVIDPGNNNILYIPVYLDGVLIRTLCLSRNFYYQESMLNYSHLHWIVWNNVPKIRALLLEIKIIISRLQTRINFTSQLSTTMEIMKIFSLSSSDPGSMNDFISILIEGRKALLIDSYQDW